MILLLDVGNTRVKWAWLEHVSVAPAGAVAHDATHRSWQREIEADGLRPRRIVVASVAGPSFRAALTLWSRDHYRLEPEFVAATAACGGVTNAYARPAALGVDRWLGLIAARRAARRPTVIVSGGTAVTIDTLTLEGHHRGGLIVPGMQMMRDARARFGSDDELVPGAALRTGAGATSPDGVPELLAALADRSIDEFGARVGEAPRVVLTGGDARLLEAHLVHAAEVVPDLVLSGLAIIATGDAARG
jgi:type III pantothenate kinase